MGSNVWLLWALASAGFASPAATLAKMGLQGIDSDFATFTRMLVILAVLVLSLTYTGKQQGANGFTGRNWTLPTFSGPATGVSWLAYFKALQLGNALQVASVDKFSLVLVALMAVVSPNEHSSTQEWVGLGLAAAGVLTLASKR